jgi:hypothetical protein
MPKLGPAPCIPQKRSLFPVSSHNVDGDELVDREAELAHQPADATAQGEPGEAGVGDDAGGNSQPEGLGLAVELAEQHAGLCPYRPFRQVNANALHQRQVDDQAAVAHGQARETVPTASHRDLEITAPRCAHRLDHIGRPGAASDHRGVAIDGAIPYLPVNLVRLVAGADDLSTEAGFGLIEWAQVSVDIVDGHVSP